MPNPALSRTARPKCVCIQRPTYCRRSGNKVSKNNRHYRIQYLGVETECQARLSRGVECDVYHIDGRFWTVPSITFCPLVEEPLPCTGTYAIICQYSQAKNCTDGLCLPRKPENNAYSSLCEFDLSAWPWDGPRMVAGISKSWNPQSHVSNLGAIRSLGCGSG